MYSTHSNSELAETVKACENGGVDVFGKRQIRAKRHTKVTKLDGKEQMNADSSASRSCAENLCRTPIQMNCALQGYVKVFCFSSASSHKEYQMPE